MDLCLVCGRELTKEDIKRGICPDCGMPVGESPEDEWVAGE